MLGTQRCSSCSCMPGTCGWNCNAVSTLKASCTTRIAIVIWRSRAGLGWPGQASRAKVPRKGTIKSEESSMVSAHSPQHLQ